MSFSKLPLFPQPARLAKSLRGDNTSADQNRHLKPGYGWFEYVDIDMRATSADGTLTRRNALYQWQEYLFEATAAAGKPILYERNTGKLLEQAGFVDIQEVVLQLPLNPWPSDPNLKNVGRWYNLGLNEGLEGFSLGPLCRVKKWPVEHVTEFLKLVKKDINSKAIHSYSEVYALFVIIVILPLTRNRHIWIARRPPASP